jgi:hypothetical protein
LEECPAKIIHKPMLKPDTKYEAKRLREPTIAIAKLVN